MGNLMRNIIATVGLASIILMNLAPACQAQRLLTTFLVCVSNEKSGDVTIIDGPNGRLIYVTCEADNWLFSIDPKSNQIADQYPVGANPRMVTFMPNGASAFAPSASTNYLNIINMTNLALVSSVALPKGSHPTE